MTHELNQRELVIDLTSGEYQIAVLDHHEGIVGPVDYGWQRYQEAIPTYGNPPAILTWGGGPLAGSRIPGTRRLVFCGYSPQWEGFYISSLGGAAYVMHRLGVDFVCIKGKAPQDSVLLLNHTQGQVEVRLEPINPDIIWSAYVSPDNEPLVGFFALQQVVLDKYQQEYKPDWMRIFAVGPASRLTNMGNIGSSVIKNGRITGIQDWAGRGGLGSQMLKNNGIAACIFGGDWEDPDLKDSKEIDGYFRQFYGDSMVKVDLGATEKYRYVPGFQTGGTFGSNMRSLDDNILSFNYTSIYHTDQERLEQHQQYILGHYLKQFNEEIIQARNFSHCGEPCSVACKKYDRQYKKDFEPYQALGPLCGIFDQRAAEELNYFVDAAGIDAIQIGGMVAWIMELIHRNILPPEDFGLPARNEMAFEYPVDPLQFDVVTDSYRNAQYAIHVVSMILFEACGEPFRKGIRAAVTYLDDHYGFGTTQPSTRDSAVYTAHNRLGCMVPNQYWVPGMLSPMMMMGKYFVYYGLEYLPPRLLGRRCVERMMYELYNENNGVCRFHRKWSETIVDEIVKSHYHLDIDYKLHHFELARKIYEKEGRRDQVIYWESDRTLDMIWQYLEKWTRTGLKDDNLRQWITLFRQDKKAAAQQYWEELYAGIDEAFQSGAEAIPDILAPFQSASKTTS